MSVVAGTAGLPVVAGAAGGVACWLSFGVPGLRRRRIMMLGVPPGRVPARIGVAAVLSSVGAFVRNGGTVVAAFEELAGRRYPVPALSERRVWEVLEGRLGEHERAAQAYRVAGEVAMACRMSDMLGCETARCLEAVAASYKRSGLVEDLRAKALAMPRSTVRLLSVLPVLTLALGEALGAAPLAFLFGSLPGLACLAAGLACYSAGLVWMGVLMRRLRDSGAVAASVPSGGGRRRGGRRRGRWEPVGGRWAALAAVMGAVTCCVALSRRRRSVPPSAGRWMEEGPSPTLVLEMVAVAIRHGASVSRTLDVIGRVCASTCGAVPGTFASEAIRVAGALNRGAEWDGAWGVCDPRGRDVALLGLLHDTLTPSWRHGASPLLRIETTIEQIDRDERRGIEEAAARLSVRVLVPMGLCVLPSFILIGVVPAVASFAGG